MRLDSIHGMALDVCGSLGEKEGMGEAKRGIRAGTYRRCNAFAGGGWQICRHVGPRLDGWMYICMYMYMCVCTYSSLWSILMCIYTYILTASSDVWLCTVMYLGRLDMQQGYLGRLPEDVVDSRYSGSVFCSL
jgi:hypothetical protein